MAIITRKTIRKGDDFKAIISLKDRNGSPMNATAAQFKFIYRDIYGNGYEVSYDGATRLNSYIDGDHLVGVFENYKLACGVLKREAWYWVDDPAFTDGQWNYGDTRLSAIELTEHGGAKEVEDTIEVPEGICINETLVISKGDKGEPFVYEDFTTDQLAGLKGDPFRHEDFTLDQLEALRGETGGKGDTPYIVDGVWWIGGTNIGVKAEGDNGVNFIPYVDVEGNLSWTNDGGLPNPPTHNIKGGKGDPGDTGGQGIQGDTGKSAYQLAVEAGYKGTEAQFKTEQATIANNSARLTSVEQSKANLVGGYVPSEEINPLQGKQTGVSLKGNSFYSANLPLEDVPMLGRGDLSVECYFNSLREHTTAGGIYEIASVARLSIYRQSTGSLDYQLANKRSDGSFERVNLSAPYSNNEHHLVLTVNRTTKLFTGYLNGVKFNSKSFNENISVEENSIALIGCNKVAAQEFTIHHFRVFNYALSPSEVLRLYEARNSENYERCAYEFKPCGVTTAVWRETLSRLNLNGLGVSDNRRLIYPKFKGSYLTPLFVARGAVFNETTGFYELNGLTDITEAQMIAIYNLTSAQLMGMNWDEKCLYASCRTNFRSNTVGCFIGRFSTMATFAGSAMENIIISPDNTSLSTVNFTNMFMSCVKLRRILGAVLGNAPNSGAFIGCRALEEVNITSLTLSISFSDSPLLTRDSIVYLITNAANTTPITLTLHADAKVRLTPEDIALASSKNITIA